MRSSWVISDAVGSVPKVLFFNVAIVNQFSLEMINELSFDHLPILIKGQSYIHRWSMIT